MRSLEAASGQPSHTHPIIYLDRFTLNLLEHSQMAKL